MWFWPLGCIRRCYFYIKVSVFCVAGIYCQTLSAETPPYLLLEPDINAAYDSTADTEIRAKLEFHKQNGHLPQLGVALVNSTTLYNFYSFRGFRRLWNPLYRDQDPLQELLAYLQQIHWHGLLANDYHFQTLMERCQIPTLELVAECDLLQSDAILTLSQHLQIGKVNPNLIFKDTEVTKPAINLSELLSKAVNMPNLFDYFRALAPSSQEYIELRKYLAELRSRTVSPWPAIDLQPSIKPQMADPRLEAIAVRLMFWGDLPADWAYLAPFPMRYEDGLIRAVEHFQLRHGLVADGVLGKKTIAALNITPQQRIEQLVVNLEQIRWHELKPASRLIKVNIPSFELLALENGEVRLRMPVIVGQLKRKTPIFEEKIQYLVLNPTWVVPWELATKDKLPLIQQNPQYLLDNQFSVYLQDFKIEDPTRIDWAQVTRANFPYRLVQAPGSGNALGQVKFMFPNPYEVYLHDTPDKSLFNNELRAFSSGCIRIQRPLDLLWWILRTNGFSDIDIENQLNKKHTNTISLTSPVPIRLEYRTAYWGLDQTIQFRADIYQRDTKLYQALQQPATRILLR
ncbi:L,D-transpeptidase family protein [Kangiella koreensis]|uniref:ErfK/YbiS/YcfS/YnhG family protein n=1 Tax=Kangiella koreensis (strain DSM 16069 / JCM 12317 / KCTC 12182 / SW-125) TaxID=523791 RepID=C7R5P4_KANKD|nr:L,D-transpeptidase family protein [Kangiella koreensis]ACV27218.1 ErfK/YbiS/YcfS/YnhG family protein [Kangiella koreensis DSM 16069]